MTTRLLLSFAALSLSLFACASGEDTGSGEQNINGSPPATCLAIPSCDAGEEETSSPCAAGDTSCRTETLCGKTIHCKKDAASTPKSKASGYDLEGPKALANDTVPVEFCAAVVSDVQEACMAIDGDVKGVNGCGHLCSKPIAPKGKAAGYDLTGFKIADSDKVPVEFCAAVVSDAREACSAAKGTSSRINGCGELCSVPISPKGKTAGYDLTGFKILDNDKVPVEFCAAVVSPIQEQCSKVGGTTSRVNGCGHLCSLPL